MILPGTTVDTKFRLRYSLSASGCLLLCFLLVSCGGNNEKRVASTDADLQEKKKLQEALIEQNKQLISEEMEAINGFADRRSLQFDTTVTGLRFKLIKTTSGVPVRLMSDVSIRYKAALLNGNICYDSDSTGLLRFTVGQSDLPSGLQEGLLKMKEGEEALMIVPSYLAYGVSGDGFCIPGSSSVFYSLKVESVINH